VVICLEQCADLHMAQLMPLPLTVSCFSKIEIGFTFLVPAHPGSPRKGAVKRVCYRFANSLCVCIENKINTDSATCPVVAMFEFKKLHIVTTGGGSPASVNVHRSTEFHVDRSNDSG